MISPLKEYTDQCCVTVISSESLFNNLAVVQLQGVTLRIFLLTEKILVDCMESPPLPPSRKSALKREISEPKRILVHLKCYEEAHNTVNGASRKCKHLYAGGIP